MLKPIIILSALALMPACASEAKQAVHQDNHGNYATTTDYHAMERTDFTRAMHDGLADFDSRLAQLGVQAEKLGPDAITEYHSRLDKLTAKRREFAAQLSAHEAMLADEWKKHREDVADEYTDLRKLLDKAYKEVIEEG